MSEDEAGNVPEAFQMVMNEHHMKVNYKITFHLSPSPVPAYECSCGFTSDTLSELVDHLPLRTPRPPRPPRRRRPGANE